MSDKQELTKKLEEAVSAFGRILEVLPEDAVALEFLCLVCPAVGDGPRAASARAALDRIRSAQAVRRGAMPAAPSRQVPDGELLRLAEPSVAVAAELALLARLEGDRLVSEPLARAARAQLSAPPAADDGLVSALAVLERLDAAAAETAEAELADALKTPPIDLVPFERAVAGAERLPADLVRRRGVVPFGTVADATLVALANPLDAELREAVAAHFGNRCHFFFASPSSVAAKLRAVADSAAAASGGPAT